MMIGVNIAITGTIVLNPPAVEEPGETLGPELSPDPEFENDGLWTDPEGVWTVAGSAVLNDPDGVEAELRASATNPMPGGTVVRTVLVIESVTDAVAVLVGGVSGTPRMAPGTYTEDIVSPGVHEQVGLRGREFPGAATVASASFKEVLE